MGGVVVPVRRLSAGSPYIDGRLAKPLLQIGFVYILSTICPAIVQSYSAMLFALTAAPEFSTSVATVQQLSGECTVCVHVLSWMAVCVHSLSRNCPVFVQPCPCTPHSRTHAHCVHVDIVAVCQPPASRCISRCRTFAAGGHRCECIGGRCCRTRAAVVCRPSMD